MKFLNSKVVVVGWNSKEIVSLVLINLVILIAFMCSYPAIFDWDGVNRIINHDRLEVVHWLPGLQVIIYLMYKFKIGLIGVRASLILISLCATAALYLFVRNQSNKRTAFICALLFMTTPRLLAVSIVPYQEMLMFLCIFLGLYFYSTKHDNIGCFFLGASCLVRYEAWIFCFLFATRQIYSEIKNRNGNLNFKKGLSKVFIIFWGITAAIILKYASPNESGIAGSFFNSISQINVISLINTLSSRIRHPIIIFIFAVLGILYCLLWIKDEKRKSLWFVILLFLLISLFPAALRVNKAPSSFRTLLIPIVVMTLFVPFGIHLIYELLNRIKTKCTRNILQSFLILLILLIVLVNLRTANGYFKATYKYTLFDEYYAASRIVKEHRGHKILIIEPCNSGNFNVTSIYLDDKDDVYIYPSLNYSKTTLGRILEKNNFALILRVGNSEDNINEMIKDIGVNRITKNGIETIYLN